MFGVHLAGPFMDARHKNPLRAPRSEFAVCCWIPLYPLRLEEARRPELAARPAALLAPDVVRRVWQVSALARRTGVRPGMTVSQAIGLCPTLRLCEPDPVHYEECFAALVTALGAVSPVVEPAELGRAFVGTDGLEGLYGGPEKIVEAIELRAPSSALRLGWGRGKFVSWTAASRAKSGQAVIVNPGDERRFLAAQPLSVLPLIPDHHRLLRRLGLRTLGDLAALPEDAVAAQLGSEGRRLWHLAAGSTMEPVIGRPAPEPVSATLSFYSAVGDRALLARALDKLIERALRSPARVGWRVQRARLVARLEQGGSWSTAVTLREPSAEREVIAAPLNTRWDLAPPTGAVERLTVEFTAFAPGTTALQLFQRDAAAAARAGRRRALRSAVREILLRLRRPMLYRVIPLEPESRIPERRYALIDYEP